MGELILILIAIALLTLIPGWVYAIIGAIVLICLDIDKFGCDGRTLLGSVVMLAVRAALFGLCIYLTAGGITNLLIDCFGF